MIAGSSIKDFWETKFAEEKTSWGFEPSDSAIMAKDLFNRQKARHILIPGIGYGRNAGIFIKNGIMVDGIEISQTAINLARQHYGQQLAIYNGSVTQMPFNDRFYDGIFCYALIHLLNCNQRRKFIRDCYNQLNPGSYMIFSVISKKSSLYGKGKQLSKYRYEITKGLEVYFYDAESVKKEFGRYGLVDFMEFDEPVKHMKQEPPLNCIVIQCRKVM